MVAASLTALEDVMNELQAICDAAAQLEALGEQAILATVVSVQGSTYRRPGARMLVTPAGKRIGSVSGGCLESDVARKAWQLTQDNPSAILTYDSRTEEDGPWSLGLGCNGRIDILVQRLSEQDHALFCLLARSSIDRRTIIVATVHDADSGSNIPLGARVILNEQLDVLSDPARVTDAFPALAGDAMRALEVSRNTNLQYQLPAGRVRVLLEVIEPPPRLIVCGAGFDARPIVDAAKAVGWQVTVTDRRARFATADHFPSADQVLVCPPEELVLRTRPDARSAAVIMHHSYADDLAALRALLGSPVRYIGLLGPKQRHDRLLADLQAECVSPTPAQLARLYGPVGLNLGAETPDEIAVAIVAEILATSSLRRGGHLRDQAQPIHDPIDASMISSVASSPRESVQCQTAPL
jgi:xanthine dehydrogenase accessory factor